MTNVCLLMVGKLYISFSCELWKICNENDDGGKFCTIYRFTNNGLGNN